MSIERHSSIAGYDVFLSHSSYQKEFAEELCEYLKGSRLSVFFDQQSLVAGEEFPKSLKEAASTCKIAVALLSEEFFSKSSWPMVEIITSMEARKPKIVPLFYKLSPEKVRDATKQEEWSSKWKGWRMERYNMDLQQWKEALKTIGITMGVEKNHLSETQYRKLIVAHIHRTLRIINEELGLEVSTSGGAISGGSSYGGATSWHASGGPVDRSRDSYAFDRPNLTSQSRGSNPLFNGNVHSGNSVPEGAISGSTVQPSYLARAGSTFMYVGGLVGTGIGLGVGQAGGLVLTDAVKGYFNPAKENTSTDRPDVCEQVCPSYSGSSNYSQSNFDQSDNDPSNNGPSNCAQVGLSNTLTGSRSSAGRSSSSSVRGPPRVPAMCAACARVRLRVSSATPLTSPTMPLPRSRCTECGRVFDLIQVWRPHIKYSNAPIWPGAVTPELYYFWTKVKNGR